MAIGFNLADIGEAVSFVILATVVSVAILRGLALRFAV